MFYKHVLVGIMVLVYVAAVATAWNNPPNPALGEMGRWLVLGIPAIVIVLGSILIFKRK